MVIDPSHTKTPTSAPNRSRPIKPNGILVVRQRVRRLMRFLDFEAVSKQPRLSQSHPVRRIYPYLLTEMSIDLVNQI